MEAALEAARRALKEETGYVSDSWRHLITIPSNATIADNYAYVFAAQDCRKAAEPDPDDTEFLGDVLLTEREIEGLIRQGGFQQALHVMAFMMLKAGF
jgi:ADP-ribose pyrophosphatase